MDLLSCDVLWLSCIDGDFFPLQLFPVEFSNYILCLSLSISSANAFVLQTSPGTQLNVFTGAFHLLNNSGLGDLLEEKFNPLFCALLCSARLHDTVVR